MRTYGWIPRFHLKVREEQLPPVLLFPTVEFIFKVVQWSFFVAAITFGAHRIGSSRLEGIATCLNALLIFIVGERISRAIYGRFSAGPDRGARAVAVVFLLAAMIFSCWATYRLSLVLETVIADFVTVSERAAKLAGCAADTK